MSAVQPAKPALAQVKGGLVAYLLIDGATKAAEFYERAFAAEIAAMAPVDEKGRTMHAHLYINGSSIMLSDPFPEHGCPVVEPRGFTLTLIVDAIEAWWNRAIAAGAEPVMPVQQMFWGDRYGQIRDPFGIVWGLNEPQRR